MVNESFRIGRRWRLVALRAGHYFQVAKPLRLAVVHIGLVGATMMRGNYPSLETTGSRKSVRSLLPAAAFSMLIIASTPQASFADEGGVSFWLPGLFGSLAAVPGTPGFSFTNILYNTNVSAGADVATARAITIGALSPSLRVNLAAHLTADSGFDFANLDYVFATPVLGGQASVALGGLFGRTTVDVNGFLTASLGPFVAGRPLN